MTRGKSQLTLRDNESSEHENHEQGESAECIRNDLCSSDRGDEPEEGQSHLVYPEKRQ